MEICWLSPEGQKKNCLHLPPYWPPVLPGRTSEPSTGSPSSSGYGGKPSGGDPPKLIDRISDVDKAGFYPELFTDLLTLEAIHRISKTVKDTKTQETLGSGVQFALDVLRKRTAKELTRIDFSDK